MKILSEKPSMIVNIAMPVVDGCLLEHFGQAKQFALVEADRKSRVIACIQITDAPPHEPGSFPRWLRERNVNVLVVGDNGIGQRALDSLLCHGIEVCAARPATPIQAVVVAWLGGRLARMQKGCDHHYAPGNQERTCQLSDYLKKAS